MAYDLTIQLEALIEASLLAQDVAGPFLVGPKVGFAYKLLQFCDAPLLARCVKGTSVFPGYGL